MLNAVMACGVFNYHPKCKKIQLTHLCFADDLLIFAKGKLESVMGIQNVLKQFYLFFGLQLNCAKSEFFSTGIYRDMLEEIPLLISFKISTLPVRYLRVPLVTRRFSTRDYGSLVDKVVARING